MKKLFWGSLLLVTAVSIHYFNKDAEKTTVIVQSKKKESTEKRAKDVHKKIMKTIAKSADKANKIAIRKPAAAIPAHKQEILTEDKVLFDQIRTAMLRHFPEGTRVEMNVEETLYAQEGLPERKVIAVETTRVDGRRNSFSASVDTKTGKIIRTYNKTIHENAEREVGIKPNNI